MKLFGYSTIEDTFQMRAERVWSAAFFLAVCFFIYGVCSTGRALEGLAKR
jgi:hypothetical protein